MRLRVLAIVLSALVVLGPQAPAMASTGGTADGSAHPNVGLLAFYDPDGRFRCSGTLVSPSVILTAAHCTADVVGQVLVTFQSDIAAQPPAPLPAAADPASGYTAQELSQAGYLYGTAHTHPSYSHFTDLATWNDVGVVVLSAPVEGIDTATLAPIGKLDTITNSDLSKTLFRAVGYGTEFVKPADGPQKPQPVTYPLLRRFVDMPGKKLTSQILTSSTNINDTHGDGGTCVGDSGGPIILDDVIVAVTSYGTNENCKTPVGNQRVDIPVVRTWLAQFGL